MESKFKIGDKVLLNKPKYERGDGLEWISGMEVYIGKIFIVKRIDLDDNTYLCKSEDINRWFCGSWLTKVVELPTEQVSNPIDWEKRRWDLYKMFIMHYSQYSIGEALNAADRCIEIYKQTLK